MTTRDEAGVKIQEQVTFGLFPNPQSLRRAVNTFDAADRLVSATVANARSEAGRDRAMEKLEGEDFRSICLFGNGH